MQLDPQLMSVKEIYQTMVRLITPRPIAWVSTIASDGTSNVAPYSFFNGVGANPPSVVFCPANKRDGTPKDSLRNIEATGEFVVNLVPFALREQMNHSAADFGADVSEFAACGIETIDSVCVRPPRVAESPAALECRLFQTMHLGAGPAGANLVIGEVVMFHICDDVYSADAIDPEKLDFIGRLGGTEYVRTRDRFDLPRPPRP